ncbi:hypothetical protein GQ600_110 [Phytophthora cactorum]|nr:hypothetical protein GQ600_110 [Phytophthora cactorum]
MAKDYQAAEKQRRAKEHNEALSRLEKGCTAPSCARVETEGGERIPQSTEDSADAQHDRRIEVDFDEELLPEDSWEPDRLAAKKCDRRLQWFKSPTRISVTKSRMNCPQGGAACGNRRNKLLHQHLYMHLMKT